MRVLLQEVVLDFPDAVQADAVGQFDLFEGVAQELFLGASGVGARELVFVEQTKTHRDIILIDSPSPPTPSLSEIDREGEKRARRPGDDREFDTLGNKRDAY